VCLFARIRSRWIFLGFSFGDSVGRQFRKLADIPEFGHQIPTLMPHPVQMHRQLSGHRYFRGLPSSAHGQGSPRCLAFGNGRRRTQNRPKQTTISPGKRACGYLEGWPPGFTAKRNHACSRLVLRLARRNGSIRCGRVCSKIMYSVRIGSPQPTSEALKPS
jgi:hypothetical protein